MVEKRAAEENGHGPDAKKARADGSVAGGKPALNLEALQKAKALLEKQKQLKEKLKKLPQVSGAAGLSSASSAAALAATANPLNPGAVPPLAAGTAAGVPLGVNAAEVAAKAAKAVEIASKFGVQASLASVPAVSAVLSSSGPPRPVLAATTAPPLAAAAPRPALGAGGGPRPLLLDAAGREVDEHGNIIQQVKAPVATSLINQRRQDVPSSSLQQLSPTPPPAAPAGPRESDFIDHSMTARRDAAHSHRRKKGALEFVEEGKFQRQAEVMRLKQKYGEADFKKHLPSHFRRYPRGPAGPAEGPAAGGAAAAGAVGDANLTPLGAPAIPSLAGLVGVSDANMVPIGKPPQEDSEESQLKSRLPEVTAHIPEVEWWDKPLLEGGAYYTPAAAASSQQQQQQQPEEQQDEDDEQLAALAGDQQQQQQQGVSKTDNIIATASDGSATVMRLRLGKISQYVEHPVPLQPPAAAPPPPPQPLKLTKKELKKMRTQRRQAREKEKQELMRQGLLEPPKPKVKISNLMRVLGEQATLDPTAIEQEVRRQMNERQAAHDDRNLARMLTPAEARDKKMRKLLDTSDGGLTSLTSVYRIEDLSNARNKFKVHMNAQENHMSGIMLVCPGSFSLVVVEGCPKSMKRYHKLMLRRIDWNEKLLPAAGEEDADAAEDEQDDEQQGKPPNRCHVVWQGVVKDPAFKEFIKEEVVSPEAARKLLEDRGVAHYWDAAVNFDFDAAPLVELP